MVTGALRLLFKGFILTAGLFALAWSYFLALGASRYSRPSFAKRVIDTVGDVVELKVDADLTMEDVCVTVKTCKRFHRQRLELILRTWHKTAKDKVYFVTDEEDMRYRLDLGNRLVTSKCGTSHGRSDLCCKLGVEYDTCMALPDKRWWCHFDDDNYVNLDRLVEYLKQFDSRMPVYIGKRSVPFAKAWYWGIRTYQFGTGGAGICISRPLAERMRPWFAAGSLPSTCFSYLVADDCAVGFVINYMLEIGLTESHLLHSHIENLATVSDATLGEQISLAYGKGNVIHVPNARFNDSYDPTRMLSLHCHIHPQDKLCE